MSRKPLAALSCGLAFVMCIAVDAAQAQKQVQAVQPIGTTVIKPVSPITKLPAVESPKTLTKPTSPGGPAAIGKPTLDPTLKNIKTGNTPLTVAAPTSPLADKKLGAGSSLDQFSRDSTLAKINNRGTDLINQANGKDAPGGGATQPKDNRITHDFDAGRGKTVSKQGQQSDGDAPTPYPGSGSADKGGGIGTSNGDSAGTLKGEASATAMQPAATAKSDTVLIAPVNVRVGNSSRPAPDGEGGDGGGRTFDKAKEKSVVADIEKSRKRQVGMPSEDKRELDKIKADEKTAAAAMSKRRADYIRPADENSGQGGVAPGSTSPNKPAGTPVGAGNPPAGMPEHGSNCPVDSPTC